MTNAALGERAAFGESRDKDSSVCIEVSQPTPTGAPTQDRGRDWSWTRDEANICIAEQPATACHWNPRGQIVVRQDGWPDHDGDHVIMLAPENVPKLVDALMRLVEADQ